MGDDWPVSRVHVASQRNLSLLLLAVCPGPLPFVPLPCHFEVHHSDARRVHSYPQQIILAFSGEVEMDKIKTVTTNIRKLKVCSPGPRHVFSLLSTWISLACQRATLENHPLIFACVKRLPPGILTAVATDCGCYARAVRDLHAVLANRISRNLRR